MKIDCRNLDCPAPVIETKNALEKLENGEKLEILLNSHIAKNNVIKFLNSLNLTHICEERGEEFYITVQKSACELNFNKEINNTILFLKSTKVGDGELGENLLLGFLSTLKNLENRPNKIICVNDSVLINTDKTHKAHEAMLELENLGVEIVSCGACLEFFDKTKELKIGSIGNAYAILNELFGKAKVITL
ncbi:sulfurtransferase-like selenium metabolism protein YedF [Campylobacter upsaliensis]|uniref:sulfurtransferase-like selenium metabolism protein YedF n=1 Tax=Campylobacter upsaliensis TaxID=28080 RepID=UPI00214A5CFF|nr:sulfurtransferase-like selenium metabolism protein YedF [Campylobacter upsaliensis]MCR2101954.1 sulfurtransferase-like selenium metabolism protein YedF [Campylobacter upsaliensis]